MNELVIDSQNRDILFTLVLNGQRYEIRDISVADLKIIAKNIDRLQNVRNNEEPVDAVVNIAKTVLCKANNIPEEKVDCLSFGHLRAIVQKITECIAGNTSGEGEKKG